jgi:hypothetical protein
VVTTYDDARRVLTDLDTFVFPVDVSRRAAPGFHDLTPRLAAEQNAQGLEIFERELAAAVGPWESGIEVDAMDVLRRPVARSTTAAVLPELSPVDRDEVGDLVLAWIDALGPVIASARPPGRFSRLRRREVASKAALEQRLADLGCPHPARTAVVLAAGIQVPVAAGAWLLVLLAEHPEAHAAARTPAGAMGAAWEVVRLRPPTWITARMSNRPCRLGGVDLPAYAVVMVSPLLLGRLASLVPGPDDGGPALERFDPTRWDRKDRRPGAWLPFGAGPHACPGRNLGLAQLSALASWAASRDLELRSPALVDQTRGIFPRPALLACPPRHE